MNEEKTSVTNELLLEVLKKIQGSLVEIKEIQREHSAQLIRVREDIHGLRGDDLRLENMQAQMSTRLERIESRLGLVDA